ncbi:MAG: MBL fold metallo-hydrolase [Candidatus Methylacidiphilales bacterium]|nr:MBL fold metallo-hydrolase [Candidatus Methylacidiphilales bacterium]
MSRPEKPKSLPRWRTRNFITEVLLPSLLTRKAGVRARQSPLFPKLTGNQICLTWIGHASFLIQTAKHNILIDPNWANWLLVIRRLKHAGLPLHDLPNIDLVLVTHAHFDHLHRPTLRRVAERQPVVVPHGVGDLVHNLGFEKVLEMHWWDTLSFDGLDITFTPAKHWGARKILDQHRGYGGFALTWQGRTVYHAGDSAWFDGFTEIGRRLRPEIALLPIGAYENPSSRDHHISPEEAVEAFRELGARTLIPMHFGTYRLSYERHHEPPQRLMLAASQAGILPQLRFLTEGMPAVF